MIPLNSILQFSKHFHMYYYIRSLQKFCTSEYSVNPILRCGSCDFEKLIFKGYKARATNDMLLCLGFLENKQAEKLKMGSQ